MIEIGIETQSTLAALVQQVERGEEIVLTREGDRIARLVLDSTQPRIWTEEEKAASHAASERIAERRATLAGPLFTWEEIKADRDFGRR